jgi:uncharacterized protein YbjT (DUF2867 family)
MFYQEEMTMANTSLGDDLTLVLGGTGKTGHRLADLLRQAGHRVRIGSRNAEPRFDWESRDTWTPALQGVRAAYVAYQPDLAAPGALEIVDAFFRQAVDSGVEKFVLLSGRGEMEAEQAEKVLQATRADWTILRSSWFCQNFSEGVFLDAILAGEVALPSGPAAEPFVDVDDIADIAFAALTEPGHSHRLYEITGPRALTFAEAIGEIAQATGRDIRFVAVPPEKFRAELVANGVPSVDADLVIYLFTTVLDGRNTPLADGVQRALGCPPREFSDDVRRTAATGVWGGIHA